MTPARLTVLEGGASVAASFDAATRIGDIAGQLLRAAQAPRRGHRGSKVGGRPLTVAEIRAEQSAAWLLALGEIRNHGHSVKIDAAMQVLLAAMDADMRAWAVARQADNAPPSGPRSRATIAADREYWRLRQAALETFGDLAGGFGGGVVRLGIGMSPTMQRKLADAAKSLSVAAWEPRKGAVAGIARFCAALARGLSTSVLRREAEHAAEACAALAAYVERWTARQEGGT